MQFWIHIFCYLVEKKNRVLPKFLEFKVSNEKLRASNTIRQKRLLNQEANNKQKTAKILQEKVIEVKNSFNCNMSCIDYVYVCNIFLVFNNENMS